MGVKRKKTGFVAAGILLAFFIFFVLSASGLGPIFTARLGKTSLGFSGYSDFGINTITSGGDKIHEEIWLGHFFFITDF